MERKVLVEIWKVLFLQENISKSIAYYYDLELEMTKHIG